MEHPRWNEPWEDRLRRLAALRSDDPDDLATCAVAEIDRLRAELAAPRDGSERTTPPT